MTRALGEFLVVVSGDPRWRPPRAAADPSRWPRAGDAVPTLTISTPSPGAWIAYSGDVQCVVEGSRGGLALAREPQAGRGLSDGKDIACAALRAGLADPRWEPRELRARYVFVFWDAARRSLTAFCDLFRTCPAYYRLEGDRIVCASDLRLVLAASEERPRVDRLAIYHYLNFQYVPSPATALEGVAKLEPGFRLDAAGGTAAARPWIDATYAEDLDGSDDALARGLRARIVENVREYRPGDGCRWGTFLSGGTDSSSIAGILARASAAPVDSYSIGFREAAFDEMGYARIASGRYGLRAHERVIGEDDAVAILPRLAAAFDEPFGNASAIGTYYCARLARDTGKETLIAGDGGDEIFGGNERYAKDYVLGRYYRAPRVIHALGRAVSTALRPIDTSPTNRIRNILRRGALPNPERFYVDDAFASDCFEELLTPGFREGMARSASLDVQRELFARPATRSELHRLMYLDLKLTLAESDIVKVLRSARMAGLDVAFPYLDRELVQYTGRFPERYKVKRTRKRYLFKKAMAGILPAQILSKKKQGFGLPVSVWLRRAGPMRELVNDAVLSPRALQRGYFDAGFVRRLISRHERGSWDHAQEIFRLLMLELWHREYLDARA